jgi:tripartite-type tricarboxylate transporter receptor subunit TctC
MVTLSACGNETSQESETSSIDKPTYPIKPIETLVGYAAGGSTDIIARTVAEYLESELGQSIVVINREGAGGEIAYTELAQASPDGYKLGYLNNPATISIPLSRKANYTLDDFEFIGNVLYHENLVVVNSEGPYQSIEDLINEAKSNPGKINVGNSGPYADDHLASLKFQKEVGVKFEDVMFEGTSPSLVALLGGHVDAVICNVTDVVSMIKDGKISIIATMGEERNPLFENAPTLKELGYDVVMGNYTTLAAPANTPQEILKILRGALESAVTSSEYLKAAEEKALPVKFLNHEEIKEIYDKSAEELNILWEDLNLPKE